MARRRVVGGPVVVVDARAREILAGCRAALQEAIEALSDADSQPDLGVRSAVIGADAILAGQQVHMANPHRQEG